MADPNTTPQHRLRHAFWFSRKQNLELHEEQQVPHHTDVGRSKEDLSDHSGFGTTKPQSAIRKLVSLAVGRSSKMENAVATVAITPCVGQSTRRNWSFTTRFTPKGPDRFYLYARPERHTEDPSFIYPSFKTEDIVDDVEMVSLDTTDFDVKMMQESPLPEMQNFTITHDGSSLQLPGPGCFPTGIDYNYPPQVVLPSCTPFIGHEWYHPTLFKGEDHDMEDATLCSAIGFEHQETRSDENSFERARSSGSMKFVVDMGSIGDGVISNRGVATSEMLSSSLCGSGATHDSHHLSTILSTLSLAQTLDNPPSGQESLPSESCKKAIPCTSPFVPAVESGIGWHAASLSGFSNQKEEDDADTDTDGDDVSVILDNSFYPPHVKNDQGKESGVVQRTSSFSPVAAHKDTCGAVLLAEQFLPTLPVDGSRNDTDNEDEPGKPLEREVTEPLEDEQDQPLAVFLRPAQGVSTGSFEESFHLPALIPKQVLPSVCDDKTALQSFEREPTQLLGEEEDKPSSAFLLTEAGNFLRHLEDDLRAQFQVPEQVLPSAVAEPSASFFRAEAGDFLRSTEVTFPSKPQVPRQVMPSAAKPHRAPDRETTEPLEEGEVRTPTAFLNYEPPVSSNPIDTGARTISRIPQQVQPSANSGESPQPFKREATEPLEEEQDRVPPVFHNYDQCMLADLLPSYADRIQDPQQVMPSSSSGDDPRKPFARKLPDPLDEAQDKPPATFMYARSIVDLDGRFMAQPTPAPLIEQGYPSGIMANTASPPSFPPFHNQSQPATALRSPHTGRRVVLNKLGRPVRQLTREQLKRALGGAPCDPPPVTTSTSTENQGNDDEDEREERKDPAKRSRRDVRKEPPQSSLAHPEKRVRFGGGRRAHFENAITRFSTRSQCSAIRPILRRTAKGPTQVAPSSSGIVFNLPAASTSRSSKVINPVPPLRSPSPIPRGRQSRRGANVSSDPDMSVQSDSEADRARLSSSLLVDELDRKNACRRQNTQCHQRRVAEAAGSVVRNARQNHREDWTRVCRRRGFTEDNSVSSFLTEPERKGPLLRRFGARFRRPKTDPVGA